jgi:sec-independent protein translocase protein TatA
MFTLASISNLFGGDMWVLLLIVLVLFGAKKLPELARGMGQAIREFNKAKDEFEHEITKPGAEMVVQEPKEKLPHNPPAVIDAPPVSTAEASAPKTHQPS